jgi:flavin-dependent thymidylate synthase
MPFQDNKVELVGWYGSDETHALSAWTSTSREMTEEKRGRIPKLLKMLAEQGHHTVFEKSSLHFLVTVDVATHVQLLKHRIGVSINAESARYKELRDDKYYVPFDWPLEEKAKYIAFMEDALMRYHDTLDRLVKNHGMTRKRAKESARFYLPYGNQVTMDLMFNWRSFYHFLQLRMKPDSQKEVFNLAEEMLKKISEIPGNPFEHTIEAFGLTSHRVDEMTEEVEYYSPPY